MNNLELIKVYQKALWNDKDIHAIDKFFHPEALINSPIESTQNIENLKSIIIKWYTAFPHVKVHWDDFICEDDKVVSRWHAEGFHEGEFLGMPASYKSIKYSGVTIYEIKNDKIVQYWAYVDMDVIKRQILE